MAITNAKLLRANYTIMLAYPEYADNPLEPTAADLNDQFVFTSNEDGMVFNVSCAILDDSANNVNQSSSDTDGTMTICDLAAVESPTFVNYEVSLDSLRDLEVDAPGLYNLLRELTITADRPFYVITRIGKEQNTPFVIGDTISIFGVNTDFPVDIVEDGTLLGHGARFKPTGSYRINGKVTA